MLTLLSNSRWRKIFNCSGRTGGKWIKTLFIHCSLSSSQKGFLGLLPFTFQWFYCLILSRREKMGFFRCQHILRIWDFKFLNWGSRELARKKTRLPHYLNGFPELVGLGFIITWTLSGLFVAQVDDEEVLSKVVPKAQPWLKLPLHTELCPQIKAEEYRDQIKPSNNWLYLIMQGNMTSLYMWWWS